MHSTSEIKVRGFHIDVFGHVNHGRYVEFLEEARWAFFDKHRPVVDRLHKRGIVHSVVKLELNYRRPACLGEVLLIETCIKEVGRSSVKIGQIICRGDSDDLVADAEVMNVFLDKLSGKPVSIKDDFLQS